MGQQPRAGRRALWAALAALLPAGPVVAQAPPKEPPSPELVAALAVGAGAAPRTGALGSLGVLCTGAHPDLAVWTLQGPLSTADGRCSLGAAALFGLAVGGEARPLACLAALRAGDEESCWTLVDSAQVPPFPDAWRDWVRDEKPILAGTLEEDAYNGTLVLAHRADAAAFDAAARGDLTYVQLFREPARYRGQVVRVEGRMKRVRRYDDPPEKAREAGVAHLYEGWLFNDDFGINPVCCVFTELPPGLRVAETMEERVRFAGYFFKRYRYKAGDTPGPNEWRDAPLLVGKVVAVLPRAAAAPPAEWGRPLLPLFLALVAGTVLFVVSLTLWLRRGDRRVRRRLAALAPRPFDLPPEPPPADPED